MITMSLEMFAAKRAKVGTYTTHIDGRLLGGVILTRMAHSCAVRATVGHIRDYYHRETGTWCTPSQALAAAYSVPDGSSIEMAVVNVGPEPDDDVVANFNRLRNELRTR